MPLPQTQNPNCVNSNALILNFTEYQEKSFPTSQCGAILLRVHTKKKL